MQRPHPKLFFGGSSEAGIEVAAELVDTYLTWGEPPALVAEKLGRVARAAEQRGRRVNFGIRLHVIVRETSQEAWEAAEDLIRYVDDATIAKAQQRFAGMDSVGQQRMAALHGGSRDRLEVSPNLWAGVGLVRGGAGTALVGNPDQVAARIHEYMELGIDHFILSGYPHLEEAYRFAELVFPRLPIRHQVATSVWCRQSWPVRGNRRQFLCPQRCARGGLESSRFLKKAAQKLFLCWVYGQCRRQRPWPSIKKFFCFFLFTKRSLPLRLPGAL